MVPLESLTCRMGPLGIRASASSGAGPLKRPPRDTLGETPRNPRRLALVQELERSSSSRAERLRLEQSVLEGAARGALKRVENSGRVSGEANKPIEASCFSLSFVCFLAMEAFILDFLRIILNLH
jgi:hypothetical protein